MKIAALANTPTKRELENKGIPPRVEWIWVDSPDELGQHPDADLYFDLDFEMDPIRIAQLGQLDKPVIINSVSHTLREIGRPFVRINGWPGFLDRKYQELVVPDKADEEKIGGLFDELGWQYRFVADIPGMISSRVLAMIINEAFYTLQDKVSTPAEIDTAMKLGTNYPFGPFEWGAKIGLGAIDELLTILSRTDSRYNPADMLKSEVKRLKFG
jgi:3-hydroxybutyryl-CoA dehydrogenase